MFSRLLANLPARHVGRVCRSLLLRDIGLQTVVCRPWQSGAVTERSRSFRLSDPPHLFLPFLSLVVVCIFFDSFSPPSTNLWTTW